MMWLAFDLATLQVERSLGLSTLAAWEALVEACENEEVMSKRDEEDLLVLDTDLAEWLKAKQARPAQGKQPRILKLLAEMFPNGVPPPGECNRQQLTTELLRREPSLVTIDKKTLKTAIDTYNRERKLG
jgi:hypothetical protein